MVDLGHSDHLGNSYHGGDGHGGTHEEGQNGQPSVAVSEVAPTFEDEDEENGDGIQLAKVPLYYVAIIFSEVASRDTPALPDHWRRLLLSTLREIRSGKSKYFQCSLLADTQIQTVLIRATPLRTLEALFRTEILVLVIVSHRLLLVRVEWLNKL